MTEHDLTLSIILISIPVIATSIIGYKTIDYVRKQHERTSIIDVFHMLNEKKNIDAEDKLIKDYKENKELYTNNHMNDDYRKCCDIIRRNYFKIGVLISERVVPAYPFYITFGYKLAQLYAICQTEIESVRRETPEFASHFTNLAIDCLDFYHNHANEDYKIKDAKTKEKIPSGKFGKKREIIKKPRKWFS